MQVELETRRNRLVNRPQLRIDFRKRGLGSVYIETRCIEAQRGVLQRLIVFTFAPVLVRSDQFAPNFSDR
jgi:hypothetical protein